MLLLLFEGGPFMYMAQNSGVIVLFYFAFNDDIFIQTLTCKEKHSGCEYRRFENPWTLELLFISELFSKP
jgi:hypothetical protein